MLDESCASVLTNRADFSITAISQILLGNFFLFIVAVYHMGRLNNFLILGVVLDRGRDFVADILKKVKYFFHFKNFLLSGL